MFIEILKAILFGIIEGICEWLPVSSTGHLILLGERLSLRVASELGGDFSEHFENMFNFVIQLGAILAVGILYWESFNVFSKKKSRKEKTACLSLAGKVLVASIPAAVVGILGDKLLERFTGKDIDGYFYNSFTVAVMLIVYGLLFILTEGLYRNTSMKNTGATADSQIGIGKAFAIGCFQALSVIPGTSRSGATILGARLLGVERRAAAEFSLAVKTNTSVP